jgi:hypothetical protein
MAVYIQVSQEERSVFWEAIVSVILSKKKKKSVYVRVFYSERFRDRAISLYRLATRHVLTRVAKCIDVDGGIFRKRIVLGKWYQPCHLNNKYRY